jgi:hypothetical protein
MGEKIYVVKVVAPPVDGAKGQERLVQASNMSSVENYMIEVKKATAEDVARLMAAGVKIEAAEVHAS